MHRHLACLAAVALMATPSAVPLFAGTFKTITIDDQVTTDYDPNVPGSASVTVSLGPNTVSRATASTTGTNGYASASVTITGAVITNTGTLSAGSMMLGTRRR